MRAWRATIGWLKGHPFAADSMLAAVIAVIVLVGLATPVDAEGSSRDPDLLAVLLALLATVPLAWRRREPVIVLTLTTIGSVLPEFLDYPQAASGLTSVIAFYSVAANCPRPESLRVAAGVAVVVTGILIGITIDDGTLSPSDFISNYVVFATAFFLGDNLQTRRAYLAQLEERADRLERERDAETRRAVAEERTRIARELHDVVAHSVSVMVVQAGAARRVLERDQARATEALQAVEATGRQALTEMRRLLGVLRDGAAEAELEPQPSLESIEHLAHQCRAAGLDVDLRVEGDVRPLPPSVGLSAYRIVQEALTNTRKHAGPARAVVTLRFSERGLDVEVSDDGRGAASESALVTSGAGAGLVGMRERVAMLGGQLRTGPRPGGGFLVRAHLPLERDAPAHA